MKIKNSKGIRLMGRILAIATAICLIFSMAITASAGQQEVQDVANGVFKVNFYINEQLQGYGTCFLINENTVITANHCAFLPEIEYDYYFENFGLTKSEVNRQLACSVVISRDFTIPATVLNSSENMDFAILKLSQPIANRKCIAFRDSKEVKAAEQIYSVGYPANKQTIDVNDASDVAFESGTINKTQFVLNAKTTGGYVLNGEYLVYSAGTSSGGNSGGPLVDVDGYAIGVVSCSDKNSCYASASSQIMKVLNDLSITYTPANAPIPPTPGPDTDTQVDTSKLQSAISKAEKYEADDYTEKSFTALEDAIADAKGALTATSQAEVDAAAAALDEAIKGLEEAESSKSGGSSFLEDNLLVIIIAAAAVVIIVVIILVVVLSKKKAAPAPAPAPVAPAAPPVAPVAPPVAPVARQPIPQAPVNRQPIPQAPVVRQPIPQQAPASNAGETTVLGAGETTVLTQSLNGGTLVRNSNNERIQITSANFSVGRESNSVDYCISGNSNISRVHARFIVRDGATYIVDNKAANGTFVNGVKVRAGQEVELKNGDKVLLADEKFDFTK